VTVAVPAHARSPRPQQTRRTICEAERAGQEESSAQSLCGEVHAALTKWACGPAGPASCERKAVMHDSTQVTGAGRQPCHYLQQVTAHGKQDSLRAQRWIVSLSRQTVYGIMDAHRYAVV
jgi:hypothetical protein